MQLYSSVVLGWVESLVEFAESLFILISACNKFMYLGSLGLNPINCGVNETDYSTRSRIVRIVWRPWITACNESRPLIVL